MSHRISYRYFFLIISLILFVYLHFNLWSNQTNDILFKWNPSHQLTINKINSQGGVEITQGAKVLAINSRRPIRGRPYIIINEAIEKIDLLVEQNGKIEEATVFLNKATFLEIALYVLPSGIVTAGFWIVGAIVIVFSRKDLQLELLGCAFTLIGLISSGIQAELEGIRGAWILGKCSVFLLPSIFYYISLLPRNTHFTRKNKQILGILFTVGLFFFIVATVEVIIYFPRFQSIEIFNISLVNLGYLSYACGCGIYSLSLLARIFKEPNKFLKKQIGIVFGFSILSIVPLIFLGIIPQVLIGTPLIPSSILILNLIMIPIGYFYVIFRHNFLSIEMVVSKSLHFLITLLITSILFIVVIYLAEIIYEIDLAPILGIIFIIAFITLFIGVSISKPLHLLVFKLLYGEEKQEYNLLSKYTATLSLRPDRESIKEIVEEVAILYEVEKYSLTIFDYATRYSPINDIDTTNDEMLALQEIEGTYLLRNNSQHSTNNETMNSIFTKNEWVQLIVPLNNSSEKVIGLLFLGHLGNQGLYNFKQIEFLIKVSNILALGIEAVTLFSLSRELSRKSILLEQNERQKMAYQIHEAPLQEIAYVINVLDRYSNRQGGEKELSESATVLRNVSVQLRDICAGLAPDWGRSLDEKISYLIEDFQKASSIKLKFEKKAKFDELFMEPELLNALIHIIAEALNNIRKHSQAENVSIILEQKNGFLVLQIEDDGIGIKKPKNNSIDLIKKKHFGLAGMLEWARIANSELEISSKNDSGLRIQLLKRIA